MARIARVVATNIPHHVTQRGNRRQKTFFQEEDYRQYLNLMAEWYKRHNVEVWAYCLMPNHVHLIAVPKSEDTLRRAISEAHRRYTRHVNFREGWRGHLKIEGKLSMVSPKLKFSGKTSGLPIIELTMQLTFSERLNPLFYT